MTVTGKRQDSALYRWLAGAILPFLAVFFHLGALTALAAPSVDVTAPKEGESVPKVEAFLLQTKISESVPAVFFTISPDPKNGSPFTLNAVPDTSVPNGWKANWNTLTAANGAYSVKATAADGKGFVIAVSASVNVQIGTSLTVTVTDPSNAQTLSGNAGLAATVSASVEQLKFVITPSGGSPFDLPATHVGGNYWKAAWDTTEVANGSYAMIARATYGGGLTKDSSEVGVTVSNATLSVTITAPAGGSTWSGTKEFGATTSVSAVSMTFTVKSGSTPVATVSGTTTNGTTWTATWDSKSVSNGYYTLEALAIGSGTSGSASVAFGVNNAAPLSVSVSSPVASETLSGTESLAATTSAVATALDFVVKSYPALSTVATVPGSSGDGKTWTASWDTTKIANGTYVLDAKATAPGPTYATYTVSGLTVSNAAPVTVSVTSPTAGVTLDATATFVGAANPASSSFTFAVRSAAAANDSVPLATVNATSGDGKSWNGTWDTKGVPNGDYRVIATAVTEGVPTSSAPVSFKIANAEQQQQPQQNGEAVTVAMTSPAQSSTVNGKITLSATANQAVDSAQFTVTGPSGPIVLGATGNGTKTVWSYAWDTASSPNGDYSVVAKVLKGGVPTSGASRSFKVANTSVSIGFTAPANGATVTGMTPIILAVVPQANDVTVRISSVADATKFSDRIAKYDAALQVWTVSWNTADFSNQKYRLDAAGTDAEGKMYYAAPLTVTVSNQAAAAQEFAVKTVSPKDGGAIYGNVPLAATVTGDPVVVKFFVTPEAGGAIVSVDGHYDAGRGAWVGTWNSTSSPNGTYKFGVVAYNAKNNKAESATVMATLTNKIQPVEEPNAPALSVRLTAPVDGTAAGVVRLVAVTEGVPTAVSFSFKRKGATETSFAFPAKFDANQKAWVGDWDSAKAEVGTYIVVAAAKDAAGGHAESNAVSQYVERQTVAEPPKEEVLPSAELAVRIVRPADGATVRGPVVVAAQTDASATRVAFFGRDAAGTQVFALAGSFSRELGAWAAYLDTKTLKDGKYQLSAAATDAAGKRVVAATSFAVANASTDAVEKVEVIPVEAVRDAAKTQPEGTKPLATDRIAPPPPDVAEKLYKECAEAGIAPARCEAWLASRQVRNECRAAGIVTKEECVTFLKRKHGSVPGCDGRDVNACAEAVVKETAGLVSADDLERAAKAIDKHVGTRIVVPPAVDGGEKEKPSADDVHAYIPVSRRDGITLDVHASPEFVRTDDETSHRSVPAVLFIDSDADGLPDDAEKRFGTKPDVADTDGDGFSDGDEVKNGYNPLGRGRLTDGVTLAPVDVAIISGAPIEHPKSAGRETDELTVETAEQQEKDEVVRLSGKARPNEIVTLFVYSYLPVVLTTEADENGDWSYDLGATLEDGQHEVYVAVTDETGRIKEKGSPLSFFVAGAQAASADEFFKDEPVETSPTVAAIAAEPVRQSMLPYAIATIVLLALAGVIAFLLFRPKSGDGTPS